MPGLSSVSCCRAWTSAGPSPDVFWEIVHVASFLPGSGLSSTAGRRRARPVACRRRDRVEVPCWWWPWASWRCCPFWPCPSPHHDPGGASTNYVNTVRARPAGVAAIHGPFEACWACGRTRTSSATRGSTTWTTRGRPRSNRTMPRSAAARHHLRPRARILSPGHRHNNSALSNGEQDSLWNSLITLGEVIKTLRG